MSIGYRWLLDEEPYNYLRSQPVAQRRRLERALDALARHPFTEPSLVEFDSEGEDLFHYFVGPYTIIYHVDHAVRRVLILQICPNP